MATKTAVVRQLNRDSITFVGKGNSGHWVSMDGPENFGGSDGGTRPKELLLLSLAGCSGSDVASVLAKKRVKLSGFEINVTAEETEDHPKVFSSMHIEYVFQGKEIGEAAVERAIELSLTKYCGVTAMLAKAMPITHSYRIENE